MKKLINFIKNVRKEMRLINWPSRADIVEGTTVVVLVSAVIAMFLTVVDFVFNLIVSYLV